MHVEAASRPLILAIEADRHRASQLHAALRAKLRAEIVVADSAQAGIDTLSGRVPSVILTSPFLSPKDDSAIAHWLRGLGQGASHVHTLAAPLLAESADGRGRNGMLAALKRDRSAAAPQDGCDPAVFAEQVSVYLHRTAAERPDTAAAPAQEPEVPAFDAAPERPWDRMDRDARHVQALLAQLTAFIDRPACP